MIIIIFVTIQFRLLVNVNVTPGLRLSITPLGAVSCSLPSDLVGFQQNLYTAPFDRGDNSTDLS